MHPIGHTWISDSLLSVTCDSHLGTTQPIGHTIRAAMVCHLPFVLKCKCPYISSDCTGLVLYSGGTSIEWL